MAARRSKTTAPSRNGKNDTSNVVNVADDHGGKALLPAVSSGQPEASPSPKGSLVIRDYPMPAVVTRRQPLFIYNGDEPPSVLFPRLGKRLADSGDVFRAPSYGSGLMLVLIASNRPSPVSIDSGKQLGAIIVDRLPVVYVQGGKVKGSRIPVSDLDVMLRSELFLGEFLPLDLVTYTPIFLRNYTLSQPGYNDAGWGQRVVYAGEEPLIARTTDTINHFLDVMGFRNSASRTNALGAALAVQLRLLFPGQNPVILTNGNKSHAGKDTILVFATGNCPCRVVSYEETDWALEKSFTQQVKASREVGVVRFENIRLDTTGQMIASSFLERFLTTAEPDLNAIGTGKVVRIPNYIVLMMSANSGSWSPDFVNRAWTIEVECKGNPGDRVSPIGNPRWEFLPANRDTIEAELRGMIIKWLEAGQPLDTSVRHPFLLTSQTIGGILKANGYSDFLGNYIEQRTADDPVRQALGHLGASVPNEWLSASAWLPLVAHLGLMGKLVPKNDRESPESRRRGLGVVLSVHVDETFVVQTDNGDITLKLEKARRRFEAGVPETRYRFVVVGQSKIP